MRCKETKLKHGGVWFIGMLCASLLFVWQLSGAQVREAPSTLRLPPDPITFQQGAGSDIASSYCLICHSAEYIYTQPPHPHEKWTEIIKKMKYAFGCPIPDENIPPLAQYLFRQNEFQPTPMVKNVAVVDKVSKNGRGNPEKGKVVYNTYCLNCHGQTGKGDGPIGKSLIPPAADLTATGKKSDEGLLKTIREGRPGTAMPSWKHEISEQEILDVVAYLRSLSQ